MKEFGLPLVSHDNSFSVTSFFMALSERVGTTPALRSLRKLKAPPRVLVFGWLALRNRILNYR